MRGYIALEGGRVVRGEGRSPGRTYGELVFTTANTGYEESLTDPSYHGQILTFAYPLIGNYGVRQDRFESEGIQTNAALARELTDEVVMWFEKEGVPAIDDVDTRDLIKHIDKEGTVKCGIAVGPDVTPNDAVEELEQCPPLDEIPTDKESVGVNKPIVYGGGSRGPEVALIDCGVKQSIVQSLVERGSTVHLLPSDSANGEIDRINPDLLFVSNGPGNPSNFGAAQETVEELIGELPISGICLGQQIVAKALGGTIEKMEYGHRGLNQPVRDEDSGQIVMTTQNHGYVVDNPGDLNVTHVNVNDETVEGLENEELEIVTRQYHPEAKPGPQDSVDFFDRLISMAKSRPRLAAD